MPTIKTEAGKTNHTEQIDNAEQSQIVLLSDFVRKFKPEEGKLRKALAGMYLCREGQDKKFVSDFLETFASSSDTLVCHDGPRLLGAVYMIPAYASVQTDYNNIFEPRKRFYYGYGASVAPGYSGNRICKDLHKSARTLCRQRGAGYFVSASDCSDAKLLSECGMDVRVMLSRREYPAGTGSTPVKLISPVDYNRERSSFFVGKALIWQDKYLSFSENFSRYKTGSIRGVCFFAEKKKDMLTVHEILCRGSLADELIPEICAFFGYERACAFFPAEERGEAVPVVCADNTIRDEYVNILYN